MTNISYKLRVLFIGIFLFGTILPVILADDPEIQVVGIVEQSSDPVTIQITEIIQFPHELECDLVTIEGPLPPLSQGDILHVVGIYHGDTCVISLEERNCSVRKIPNNATTNYFSQSLHCSGKIMRIFEMKEKSFYDLSVNEVLVVTYQKKEMCQTITIQVDPVKGFVEKGLEPGDIVEFLGTYDEDLCMGSLDWYEDYLRKERKSGISLLLVVGGCIGYLISRTRDSLT